MRDKYFDSFIEEFGEATQHIAAPSEAIEKWRGKLPDQLLHYWKIEGWNSYQDGLFSIVNPDDYEGIVDMWLEDTPFESMDAYHVIARSGFGDLCLYGEKTGTNLTISCAFHAIYFNKENFYEKKQKDADLDVATFFSSRALDSFDLEEDDDIWLFSKAVEKYGPLNENQMFGFEPAIILGGDVALENIRKLDMYIHLDILRQFSAPEIDEY
ncbi:GAD-like domain-containing protein [Xenorhabdus entomophaga]|uniref:GAD-like domain-containing protein n=1 Tax=Xenorhabdus entomophaga TaxID=3136257 RepID=UPI0030F46429